MNMTIEVDEQEVEDLINQMVEWEGDESGFYHLANYILDCMYEQYPHLKTIADQRFK